MQEFACIVWRANVGVSSPWCCGGPPQRNIRIPKEPKHIYSVNTGNSDNWDEPTKEFIRWTKRHATPYSHRYIGSMVSDVHRWVFWLVFAVLPLQMPTCPVACTPTALSSLTVPSCCPYCSPQHLDSLWNAVR